MILLNLFDAARDPVGIGIVAVVILLVIGLVVLLAAALVVFLWYRKRSRRHLEIAHPDNRPPFTQ